MKHLYLLLLAVLLSFPVLAQNVESEVEKAILAGNADKLLPYFGSTVDLRILDVENVYGNAQAQVLLNHFFTTNPPTNFTIVHKKTRTDSSFFIGTYTSRTGTYRISVILKTENDKQRISQIHVQNSEALEGGRN